MIICVFATVNELVTNEMKQNENSNINNNTKKCSANAFKRLQKFSRMQIVFRP